MIIGLDISTTQIDAAIIALEHDVAGIPTVTFRHATIPQTKGAEPLYRRVERARHMTRAIAPLFDDVDGWDVQLCYIEEPRGRFRNDALTGTFDSVCTAIPARIAVSGLQPQAWRRELGLPARLSKDQAIQEAFDWIYHHTPSSAGYKTIEATPTEHQAEALLIAIAGRQLNNRYFAGAA